MDLLPFPPDPLYVTEDDNDGSPQCSSWVWQMGGTTQQISVTKGPHGNNVQKEGLVWVYNSRGCLLGPMSTCRASWKHGVRAAMHILIGNKQGTRLQEAKGNIFTKTCFPITHFLQLGATSQSFQNLPIVLPARDQVFTT